MIVDFNHMQSFWIDPLGIKSPFSNSAKIICNMIFNKLLFFDKMFGVESPILSLFDFPLQVNPADCGPLICHYMMRLCFPTAAPRISVFQIRKIILSISPNKHSDSIGYGDEQNEHLIGFLSFDHNYVDVYSAKYISNSKNFVFPTILTRAIIAKNKEYVLRYFCLQDIASCKVIFYPVYFRQSRWILIVTNININTISVYDPSGCLDMSCYLHEINSINQFISNILLLPDKFRVTESFPTFQTSIKFADSGPLICGFMRYTIDPSKPKKQNLKTIRLHAKRLISISYPPPKMKPNIKTSTIIKSSRIALAQNVLNSTNKYDIETFYNDFVDHIYILRNIKPRTPYLGNKAADNKLKGPQLQQLFMKNPKAAMKHVLPDTSSDTHPTPECFTEFHNKNAATAPLNIEIKPDTYKSGSVFGFHVPTPDEIVACLKSKDPSSPGNSGITYKDILYCDPSGIITYNLFEIIFDKGLTPKNWKNYLTLMIPKPNKDGEYHLPSSWRGIALQECIYKLLTTLLCKQLIGWIRQHNLLHPLQKSLGPNDGCADHTFLLRSIIDYYKRYLKKQLKISFMDMAAAFDTISVSYILELMNKMNVEQNSTNLIKEFYNNCTTTIVCAQESTKPLAVNIGVRQGCPLSMLLFNIGINPILIEIDLYRCGGILLGSRKISCMAYADDLVFLATNKTELQDVIEVASSAVKDLGMSFRASKCAVLDVPFVKKDNYIIDGVNIPHLSTKEGYLYLGCFVTRLITYTPQQLFDEVIREVEIIYSSSLSANQKLHAYKFFEHSKFIFYFRNTFIPFYIFEMASCAWDIQLRSFHKKILGLQDNASTPYLYCPKAFGGVGITSLKDEYYVQSITHSFYLLNSTDPNIIAANDATLRRPLGDMNITHSQVFDWLNDGFRAHVNTSWWNKTQHAIHDLQKYHKIIVNFKYSNPGVILTIKQQLQNENHKFITNEIFKLKDKDKISETLRQCIGYSWVIQWNEQSSAGRYSDCLSKSPLSTSPIYSSPLGQSEWRFIHQARSYTVPVRCRPGALTSITCRRGCPAEETLAHMLVGCNSMSSFWNARHNSIQDIIAKELATFTDAEVYVNEECAFIHSAQRVDLQICFREKRKIFLIDVKCPYETEKNIYNADMKNIIKYWDLREQIQFAYGDSWKVELDTFIVGPLGSWLPNNELILNDIFLGKRKIPIARACVQSNIKWSALQWRDFQDPRANLQELQCPILSHNPDDFDDGILDTEGDIFEHDEPLDVPPQDNL